MRQHALSAAQVCAACVGGEVWGHGRGKSWTVSSMRWCVCDKQGAALKQAWMSLVLLPRSIAGLFSMQLLACLHSRYREIHWVGTSMGGPP